MKKDRAFVRAALGVPFVPPGRVTRVAMRARGLLSGAHRAAAPPSLRVLEGLFGLFDNRVLGLLVELEIPEHLESPATVEQLAEATKTAPQSLERVLRYAASRGFVARDRKGRFKSNDLTTVLRRDHPNSWRGWVELATSDWFWQSFRHADAALAPGGGSGIEAATGHEFFEYVNQINLDGGRAFNSAMEAGATLQAIALAHGLNWDSVKTVCDVGGGTGAALECLMRFHPHLRSTLFDLPEVVAQARESIRTGPLAQQCEIMGGDFFSSVPPGHDRYLMLAIIHDWSDEEAARILSNVRKALPDGGRAIVVEGVLPESPRDELVSATDLLMLVLASGRERTQRQFESLFAMADLRLKKQTVLPSGFTAFELVSD